METSNEKRQYIDSHFNNVKPFIDIRYADAPRIYISKNVLLLIGSPNGVRVLFDKTNKVIAFQPSELSDPDCFPVIGKTVARTGVLKIGSVSLVSQIWDAMDWDVTCHYQILPKYYESDNIAAFHLDTAAKILSKSPPDKV